MIAHAREDVHMRKSLGFAAVAALALSMASVSTAPATAQGAAPAVTWLRSIPLDLATEAAKAALAACRGKHASVGVVDHDGHMIVLYVDDYATMIGQKALPQKLHAAIIRQSPTQVMVDNSKEDKVAPAGPEVDWEAKIIDRFNEGALISPGAIPLFTGVAPNRMLVGAIGVAGASPPGAGIGIVDDDEVCARAGVAKIQDRLK